MPAPTTSVLDDFNRADSGTLGANWSTPFETGGFGSLTIISNQCGSDAGFDDAYWSTSFAANQDVFTTISTMGDGIRMYARIQSPNTAGRNAYALGQEADGHGAIYKVVAGTTTALGGGWTAGSVVVGDKIWLNCNGTTITAYVFHSGAWNTLESLTDSAVTGAGFIGLQVRGDATPRFDDFGGGAMVVDPGFAGRSNPPPFTIFVPRGIPGLRPAKTTTKTYYNDIPTETAVAPVEFPPVLNVPGGVTRQRIPVSPLPVPAVVLLTFSDSLTLTDDPAKTMVLLESDALALSDIITPVLTPEPTPTAISSPNWVPFLGAPFAMGRAPRLAGKASPDLVSALTMNLSDTITLSDAAAKAFGLSEADTITLTDAAAKAMAVVRADSVSLADAIAKSVGMVRSDSTTLTDQIAKAFGVSKSDVYTLTDGLGKTYALVIADSTTLSDHADVTGGTVVPPTNWLHPTLGDMTVILIPLNEPTI